MAKEYEVVWGVTVSAESAVEAAQKALELQLASDSVARYFKVTSA